MSNDKQQLINATQAWVEKVVVKYNICPFARQEVERGSIRYRVVESSDVASVLTSLIEECFYLTANEDTETTIMILANGFESFDYFLDLTDLANELLYEQDIEGIYQLAHFHPDYCFAGEPADDPANYTNRSPYPALHIIREATMEKALKNHPDPQSNPTTEYTIFT